MMLGQFGLTKTFMGAIPGERFNRAVLNIWLGADPIQLSLKKPLLGADGPAL